VIEALARTGTRLIALRSAGFNHVDLHAAAAAGLVVARVPAYSPHAVAEHTLALILTLNRKTHRAYNRVREGNFALDGLMGFDLHGKTAGIVGTGRSAPFWPGSCPASAAGCWPSTPSEPRLPRHRRRLRAARRPCSPKPTSSRCNAR
jgi:hypothetical protein